MSNQQGGLPMPPSRPVQNGAPPDFSFQRPGNTTPAKSMANGAYRTNGTLSQGAYHGGIKAKRTRNKFPHLHSPKKESRVTANTAAGPSRTTETVSNHGFSTSGFAPFKQQTRDLHAVQKDDQSTNQEQRSNRPRNDSEQQSVLDSMPQPHTVSKAKEPDLVTAVARHGPTSELHTVESKSWTQGLGAPHTEATFIKKDHVMPSQLFSGVVTHKENGTTKKASDRDTDLPEVIDLDQWVSQSVRQDRPTTKPAERPSQKFPSSTVIQDKNSVPHTNGITNDQQTREHALGLPAHRASSSTSSGAPPRSREAGLEKPRPSLPSATVIRASPASPKAPKDLDAVGQQTENSKKPQPNGHSMTPKPLDPSRTQPFALKRKASPPRSSEAQSSEQRNSDMHQNPPLSVPSLPAENLSKGHEGPSSAPSPKPSKKAQSVEDRRLAIVAKHDPAAFDSLIYTQDGARSPPLGVSMHRDRDAHGESKLESRRYLHTNPRIHGMHNRSSDWQEGKAEEIRRRGNRKRWFGKPAERRGWLRRQEALREAGEFSERPMRKDPKPWGHHRPSDFGAVQEDDLPSYVKENPAWLKICARLREDKANRLQLGVVPETSHKQDVAVQKAAVVDEAIREKNREQGRKQAAEEVRRQLAMEMSSQAGARTASVFNNILGNSLERGPANFPAPPRPPGLGNRGGHF
jgi:hypothetical protein